MSHKLSRHFTHDFNQIFHKLLHMTKTDVLLIPYKY